jgi:integrating conjugative element protein (TIGR03759 family)
MFARILMTAIVGLSPPLVYSARITNTETSTAQPSQAQADTVERATAQYWGLNIEEYRRYQLLMKGVRGSLSDPKITPIEVLGIHARDDAERRKYAETFARLMADDTSKVLRFQDEYQLAFHRLFGNMAVIDLGPHQKKPVGVQAAISAAPSIPSASSKGSATATPAALKTAMSKPTTITPGDRVLIFTSPSCGQCETTIRRSIGLAQTGVTIDLYIVGAASTDEVQKYARRIAVDPALVQAGRITLNLDNGTLARVLPKHEELPQIVRKRGAILTQLAVTDL